MTHSSKKAQFKSLKNTLVGGFTLMLMMGAHAEAMGSKKAKAASKTDQTEKKAGPQSDHVAGQLLVAFKEGTPQARRAEIFKSIGAIEKSKVGSTELYLIELPATKSLDATIESLQKVPEVRFAEKNMTLKMYKPQSPNSATE